MKIIQDSREQKGLFNGPNVIIKKLNCGDYSTEKLEHTACIERKSPADLYGSIIQGHDRFRREILRAKGNNIELEIFTEVPERVFYSKRWPGGYKLKTRPQTLAKIIATISKKYKIKFTWCKNRIDMQIKVIAWLKEREDG